MKTGLKELQLLIFIITAILISCKPEVEDPIISDFQADSTIVHINSEITFTIESPAEFISIWTGDTLHNYDNYLDSIANSTSDTLNRIELYDNGIALTETSAGSHTFEYTYSYSEPGVFKVIAIASSVGDDGNKRKETTRELSLTILNSK